MTTCREALLAELYRDYLEQNRLVDTHDKRCVTLYNLQFVAVYKHKVSPQRNRRSRPFAHKARAAITGVRTFTTSVVKEHARVPLKA
jgi:hypothetical protein